MNADPMNIPMTTQIRPRHLHTIKKITADYFEVTLPEMEGQQRNRTICLARHIAIYFCRRRTGLSLPMIARYFGDRDHTAIHHAANRIDQMRRAKPRLRELHNAMNQIEAKIIEYENSDVSSIDPHWKVPAPDQIVTDLAEKPLVSVTLKPQQASIEKAFQPRRKKLVEDKRPLFNIDPGEVIAAADQLVAVAHEYKIAMFTTREKRVCEDFMRARARLRKATEDFKKEASNG